VKNIIIDWLKTKKNYWYYESEQDEQKISDERLADMLFSSRVHFGDLSASLSYITVKKDNNFDIQIEAPSHHKYNFENFNIKRNEYVYDKIKMKDFSKYFTTDDVVRNRAIVLSMLFELKHSYKTINKFLVANDRYTYKDIFFDTDEKSVDSFIDDAKDCLINNSFSMNEFKVDYIDKIKNENRSLQAIGIFYPFKIDHNIFDDTYHLFEINHLRFLKQKNNFKNTVRNFYKKYACNSDRLADILKLENFFAHPGLQYLKHFAYFDPFKNFNKYEIEYKQIKKTIENNKKEYKEFIFELFEFLNEAQVVVVKFQHENLIDSMVTNRSKNRQYSVRELADIQLNKLYEGKLPLYGMDFIFYKSILESFTKQPVEFRFTKETKIAEMKGYEVYPEYVKQNAQLVLDDFLLVLNKDDTSNLNYIYEYCMEKASRIFTKYGLKKDEKQIIHNMVLDLIFFYNDSNKEKLSKPYNSTIEKIYFESQHLNIDHIVDFDFQKKFIKEHCQEFEKYMPMEIKTEEGKIKYMFTWGSSH
jgi:hypothetical protein